MTRHSQDQVDDSDPRQDGADVAPVRPVPPKDGALETVAQGRIARLGFAVLATVIEASAIYLWLRLYEQGHPWWGAAGLIAGKTLETGLLRFGVACLGRKRWGTLDAKAAGAGHFWRAQRITGWARTAEIGIWVLWLEVAAALGQPVAAGVLLVLMHFKHHVETAALMDIPFRTGFFSVHGAVASAGKVAGAVACLALIRDGQPVLGAAVLGLGIMVQHKIQIDALHWETRARDIRLPRDRRWRFPSRSRQAFLFLFTRLPRFWRFVQRVKPLERRVNRLLINRAIAVIEPRPNPLSTMAPYTSWASLTDREFSGRHLPPVPQTATRPVTTKAGPPSIEEVAQLFRRSGDMKECPKSTVLFAFFAQWFTDGFLRTSRTGIKPGVLRNTLRNESTHEIDLAQLYGIKQAMTDQLRAHDGGRLKSQVINGEEYPQYLCRTATRKEEFDELFLPVGFEGLEPELKNRLFATGTDVTNFGVVAFNVLFLREHNRIARRLGAENPDWDDDHVFQTARNILIVVLLRIVVEEYINHITPNLFEFRLLPGSFPNARWHRPNWMAIEFNLLYRWHSLVPSTFHLNGGELKLEDMLWDTGSLVTTGLGTFMAAASSQPAGRIGLFNTDEFLITRAETPSIAQARVARLSSYNDYRRLCGLPPAARFSEISTDKMIQRKLSALYGSVEDVEFFVGLFAEKAGPDRVLPPLMTTMVAFDAFSQALTNPLLAPRIFNQDTFSPAGMETINDTRSISDLVHRNVPRCSKPYFVSLTRQDHKRA